MFLSLKFDYWFFFNQSYPVCCAYCAFQWGSRWAQSSCERGARNCGGKYGRFHGIDCWARIVLTDVFVGTHTHTGGLGVMWLCDSYSVLLGWMTHARPFACSFSWLESRQCLPQIHMRLIGTNRRHATLLLAMITQWYIYHVTNTYNFTLLWTDAYPERLLTAYELKTTIKRLFPRS